MHRFLVFAFNHNHNRKKDDMLDVIDAIACIFLSHRFRFAEIKRSFCDIKVKFLEMIIVICCLGEVPVMLTRCIVRLNDLHFPSYSNSSVNLCAVLIRCHQLSPEACIVFELCRITLIILKKYVRPTKWEQCTTHNTMAVHHSMQANVCVCRSLAWFPHAKLPAASF